MREVLKDATVTLNYIFEVRWITSERSALRRIIDNFEGLIKVLQKISESENFDAPTKDKAGSLANKLQNKNFFMLLNFRADLAKILTFFSLEFQKRHGILMDQVKNYQVLKLTLEKAGNVNGDRLRDLLKYSKCGSSTCQTLDEMEYTDDVTFHGIPLLSTRPARKRAKSVVYPKLSEYRFLMTKALVEKVNKPVM